MTAPSRLETALADLTARRAAGERLSALESSVLEAMDEANAAEANARESFSRFYAQLAVTGAGGEHIALSPEVADAMTRWVEAGRRWDQLSARFLESLPRVRARTPVRPAARILLPTSPAGRDALSALFAPSLWQPDRSGTALLASLAGTDLRLDLDGAPGFTSDWAVQQIARHGSSVVLTFLALVALWNERCAGQPPETYLSVYASDLLRFQGRRETPRGGYHRDDLLAKGRDIYFLSRISVPIASSDGRRAAMGRLLSLETLEAEVDGDDVTATSVVRFRFHLGDAARAWFGADGGRGAMLPGKLLAYHPVRQKYQILLGLCIAWWDRSHPAPGERRLKLTELMDLASIPMPTRRLAEFLESLEDALRDLSRDGVVAGLRLEKPADWPELLAERKARVVLERAFVVFPELPDLTPAPLRLPGPVG